MPPFAQVSPACWHLIKAMLQSEIGDRPNAAEVLRHPWMQIDVPPDLLTLNDRLVQVGLRTASREGCTSNAKRDFGRC
jgi:hypothetical protein